MERGLGQLRVEGPPFIQHQFFPGGGLTPSDRGPSAVDRSEMPWAIRESGMNWNSSGNGDRAIYRNEWNERSWRWDGAALSAQRVSGVAERSVSDSSRNVANGENGRRRRGAGVGLELDSRPAEGNHRVIFIDDDDDETELRSQTFFGRHTPSPPSNEPNPYSRGDESPEDEGGLALKLGGSSYPFTEENGAGKRGRSPSPQSQVPTCQVDGCTADLSQAKDYHRRHKVCEVHSKVSTALISRVMQRFCQQCSRFHPLDKFDDDKRSCRRRLEGHNKRRRKAQPDAGAGRSEDQTSAKNTDIMALLGVLSQLKDPLERASAAASDRDILLQCLRQAGNLPNSSLGGLTRAAPSWNQLSRNSDVSLPQIDLRLLASQLTGPAAMSLPLQDTFSMLLQNNLSNNLKQAALLAQGNMLNRAGFNNILNGLPYPSSHAESPVGHAGPQLSNPTTTAPGMTVASCSRAAGSIDHVQLLANAALSLQQSVAAQSAGLGNHLAGNVHGMAQPTVQRFVPEHAVMDMRNVVKQRLDRSQEDDVIVPSQAGRQRPASQNGVSQAQKNSCVDLEQAQVPAQRPSIDLQQPPSDQYSDASETGSGSASGSASGSGHQSPGTPSREWENSRISLKLFDKHPGDFPEGLRSQIEEWLSHRPLDMEGFIRPGCIILNIFLSIPKSAWTVLINDLPGSLKRLLSSGCGFWCTGRILVQVERQLVFIVDGEIVTCRSISPLENPHLSSVRPLAVVAGQPNRLAVRGFNLTRATTRLLCAFRGKYFSEEVYRQSHVDDESVASVSDSDVTEDTVDSLVLSDRAFERGGDNVQSLGVGEVNNEEHARSRRTSVDATSPSSSVVELLASGTDACELEDSAEYREDRDDTDECPLADASSILLSSQAVFNLDKSIFLSTMAGGKFGRCFIEVDQDTLQGNWKPVIVADEEVCAEIRTLEAEIDMAAVRAGRVAEQRGYDLSVVLYCTELARLAEEEDVSQFLNELGWFFQRSCFRSLNYSSPACQVSSSRFHHLLVYAVERNWCALVRKMLDIAFENDDWDATFVELSEMPDEGANLLHRAVGIRSRSMVELLLDFSPAVLAGMNDPDLEGFKRRLEFKRRWGSIFKADMRGPRGLTPLHIAASMKDAEDVVDALISGPFQAGLHTWVRCQDDSGATPLDLALLGRNMKSVTLVRAKLAGLEKPDSIAFDVAPGWDHHLKGKSLVQLELPVWSTSRDEVGGGRVVEPQDCREADFARLPRSVCGVRGAMYRPFLVSIMGIACICVCVCLLLRGPQNLIENFSWSGLDSGKE